WGHRIGSFLMAFVFLITTIGFTALIYLQSKNSSNEASPEDQQQALQEALAKQQNSLEGTMLSDFTPTTTLTKTLKKEDIIVGDGTTATKDSKLIVHYTGALAANGKIFGSTKGKDGTGEPMTTTIEDASTLIAGWKQGIPGMKVGGKRRLIIPYALAYREEGDPPTIPAKADLVFDIELIAIE
ncbi:MAG: FKBP-type peptidyl-prolyl cis-trans isomerase, partial [bacterium]|nr:FKBP-type peptidyl-prolyl cis-trans isomerase [bacterium]